MKFAIAAQSAMDKQEHFPIQKGITMATKKTFLLTFLVCVFFMPTSKPLLAQEKLTIDIHLEKRYYFDLLYYSILNFEWRPSHYRFGVLKVGDCETPFRLWDLNWDNKFDWYDSAHGTNIALDRDNDGKFISSIDHVTGLGIIEFCNHSFLLDSMSTDGNFVRLIETELSVPHVGEKMPDFSLVTTEGNLIKTQELKGRLTVLDFWASYCIPCVKKFTYMKKIAADFGDNLDVIAIDVDPKSRLEKAKAIIEKYQLKWSNVLLGKYKDHPFWKVFGSMDENWNLMGIPFYVLIDTENRIRYAGRGRENLAILRINIEHVLAHPTLNLTSKSN